jgi:hypothetical protein
MRCWSDCLSSLTGLREHRDTTSPALKRWAILGSERIDAPSQINPFAMAARESAAHQQTEML